MKIRDLSPNRAAEIVETYLRESAPPTRDAFLALLAPILARYDDADGDGG